ncbi:hypothetical protein [Oligoflexus tunisiensis]|uniref:hypothetical protein n=1 Tax=Oligoflexus tunisiensis TaxID=708132 RepID=UPI00114CD825|nr:hypothetical protein [Oligoflexus tunisiensis]
MKVQLLASLMLLVSQVSWAEAAHDKLHTKFMMQVPYGTSYFDYKLAQPKSMNPIRVLFTVSPSCPEIPATAVSVKYEGSSAWQKTTHENGGYFAHSNQKVDMIRFNLTQYSYQFERCELNILTKVKEQREVYAGYLPYDGGFAKDLEIQLVQNFKSNRIKFDVPDFCRGIEIQSVRLRNDAEQVVPLKKTGSDTFELNETQDFDALLLTLNGPKRSCDIPVYVYEDVE